MSNITLIIQLILALILIGIVLLQRSEGGGLGIGGGGGAMTGRQAATALGKATWFVAIAFLVVSLALTIITAREQAGDSVIERIGGSSPSSTDPADPLSGGGLLPPIPLDEPAPPPSPE